ncbi:hypothetical protein ACFLQR_02590 [Verrucomicrobiota bacterium]
MRKLVLVLQMVMVCALAQAQEGPGTEWSSLKLTLTSLKNWGTKHYSYSAAEPGGKVTNIIGTITVSTELTEDAIVLRDSFQMTYRGERLSLEMVHTCRKDNFLSPTRIDSKGEGSDEVATFVATITKGKATVRSQDGRKTTRDIPDGAITMAAMMRLVTLVPRTPGNTYSYKYSLESEELNLKENYRLIVLHPETITSGNQQVKCSKFQLTGGGIHPAYYWVTEDGVLQRVLIDDRKVMERVRIRRFMKAIIRPGAGPDSEVRSTGHG